MASPLLGAAIPDCSNAVDLFTSDRSQKIQESIRLLNSIVESGNINKTVSEKILENAIAVGIPEGQLKEINDLVNTIINDPTNISLVKKSVTETLRSIVSGVISTFSESVFSIAQLAMDEAARVIDEFETAKEALEKQLDDNEDALNDLTKGVSFNQLRFDIANVSAKFRNGILDIENTFKDNPPRTPEDFNSLETKLEFLRGLVCSDLNSEAQKYVSAIATYLNMLAVINQFIFLSNSVSSALNRIKANICRLSEIESAPSDSERLTDLSRSYLANILLELNDIDDQLKEAVSRQDPYALANVISAWCSRIANLIALIDGVFTAPAKPRDPTKEILLDAICKNLDDIDDISVQRLELERDKIEQAFGLIAFGAIVSISFSDLKDAMNDLSSDMANLLGFMPSGQFEIIPFVGSALTLLDKSGLDIAFSLFTTGDVENLLKVIPENASSVASALDCVTVSLKDDPSQGIILERIQERLQGIQVADSFAAINVDQLRIDGVNLLEIEIEDLNNINNLS